MYKNFDRYILIAVLIVALVILYFVFKNKKDTGDQSSLLLAMAEKLGAVSKDEGPELILPTAPKEDDALTVHIAEKLYFKKPLTKTESDYVNAYTAEVEEELKFSNKFHPLVNKLAAGTDQLTADEQDFYNANKDIIDAEVEKRKTPGKVVPLTVTHSPEPIKGANPPMAPAERLKLILSFFDDGAPKNVTHLSELYAQHTGTKLNKGNMSAYFGKLEGTILLHQDIQIDGRWKVYYGLPEWFDGKKLKKEYKQKIQ